MSREATAHPESHRIVGVVPCAGESLRMGRSKALLDAGGLPFLARVVATLRDGGCDAVVVVVREPPTGEREEELARGLGARAVVNPDPSDGPISSLRTALRAMDPPPAAVVLLPVDHPEVRSQTVRALLDGFHRERPPVAVPRYGDQRGHPAVFSREIFPRLLDPGLEGGARTVVRELGSAVLELPVSDAGVLQDIDRPEDYHAVYPGLGDPS